MAPTPDRSVVAGLLSNHSLEISAKDIRALDEAGPLLPPSTAIAIAYFPNEDTAARIHVAAAVLRSGHVPIPHFAARRIPSADELTRFLTGLREAGALERVFLVAGDPERPLGPYVDTLALIETGAFDGLGVKRIGIAGYPDGHPRIATADLWTALHRKVEAIEARGHEAEIVTQFSFDAGSVLRWLRELRDRGVHVPVKIGVPGPISLTGLVHFAARSGVSASASALAKYGTSLGKVIGTVGPLPFMQQLAEGLGTRDHGPLSLHFFTFGALHRTVGWIRDTHAKHDFRAGGAARN